MCFYVSERYPDELTAEEDIITYKKVLSWRNKGEITSFLRGFVYKLNKLYELDSKLITEKDHRDSVGVQRTVINEGFHSYRRLPKEKLNPNSHLPIKRSYVECTVPKGSKYYMNDEEIVSDSIIINKIINP